MHTITETTETPSCAADQQRLRYRVPSHLARLINPTVLAERICVVEARLHDEGGTRVRRRRCAEIIASHLLETVHGY